MDSSAGRRRTSHLHQWFGVCAADGCRAPYLDRTRAGRQRYCCELCNNRAAAAAYRSRTRRS
ncbi:CGNR zinc finger domain-containing protein [Micromonospora sp. NBC_00898]|uniref:CGNR zinc finger domain-containing protein n=1 Tax=Micromonospora sp. NBC_00898 TaxID=2975981 RepID=UPI00386743D5